MPAEKRCGLDHSQRLAPVEPASQPDEGETGSIRGTARFDVAFLVESQLFTQKEIPRRKRGAWAQAKAQEPQRITEEPQQRICERYEVVGLTRELDHHQGLPLRHRWLFLPIVTAGRCDVQRDEDGIFAEHRCQKSRFMHLPRMHVMWVIWERR
jgi:hypothetical protein